MLMTLNQSIEKHLTKGGRGSGNFGHAGRPGEIGGSGEGLSMEQGFKVRDKVTEKLQTDKFKVLKVVPHLGQSSGVYIIKTEDGKKAIWKEQKGIKPVHLAEAIVRREPAAYEVDRLLGVNMTPPTAMREFNGEKGYVQGFAGKIDPRDSTTKGQTLAKISDDEIARAAMFDYVINERDRYLGNFRVTPKPDGSLKLRLIDNASAFGHEKDKLQAFTFLHEAIKRGVDISPQTRERIKAITPTIWNERLKSTLSPTERKEAYERLQNVINGDRLSKTLVDKPVPNFKFRKGYK